MIKELITLRKDVIHQLKMAHLFCFSLILVSFGQPDRYFLFPLLAYLLGFGAIVAMLLEMKKMKRRLGTAFLWFFLVNLFHLNWLATTTYHGRGILLPYVLICALMATHFTLATLLLPKEGQKITLQKALCFASCYALLEYSKLFYFSGFPFNNIGLVLSFHPIAMQGASILGVYGFTFWTLFIAVLAARVYLTKQRSHLASYVLFGALPFIVGGGQYAWRLAHAPYVKEHDVMLVQTGLLPDEKWEFNDDQENYVEPIHQWQRVLSRIEESGQRAFDYIVLPEGGVPGDAYDAMYAFTEVQKTLKIPEAAYPSFDGRSVWEEGEGAVYVSNIWILQAISNMYGAEVLAGMLEYNEILDQSYNSMFHFLPNTEEPSRYDKQMLVPMAEYLPIKAFGSYLEKFGIYRFFTPGSQTRLFHGKRIIAPSICFEEGFSFLVREGRKSGANLFVNVTNDGWFPYSRLPTEHFNVGRLRAVENGVFLLRACNTGITAVIDPCGRVIDRLDELDDDGRYLSASLVAKIADYQIDTIYARYGDKLILFPCFIYLSFSMLAVGLRGLLSRRYEILPLLKKEDIM